MLARFLRPSTVLARLVLVTAVAATGIGAATAAAPATPPASELAAAGYPELRITVREDGVEAPSEVPAGRYRMVVEAAGRGDVDVHLVQLPPGLAEADAEAALAASGEEEVPAVVHEWDFAGGLFVPQGATDHLVLDLTPGDWFILGADGGGVDGTAPPADPIRPLTVTSGGDAPVAPPAVDATVTLDEFAFAGLPDGAAAGPQVWQITNAGEQAHHIIFASYPGAITVDQVRTLVALGDEGTPPPDFPVDPEQIAFEVAQVHVLSPGRTIWVELALEQPGSYMALCFMPDPETGTDHASLGMVDVFTLR